MDANLLIYAHVRSFSHHVPARKWLDDRLNGSQPVGLPWASLLTFLRLVSNPRVFEAPEPIEQAWEQVKAWVGCEPVWTPHPTARHVEVLDSVLTGCGPLQSNHVPDAHLAALSIEHGLTLCTTDEGFARFPGLRWNNPLA